MDHPLIYKYLSNNATEEEVALLFQWIDSNETNKVLFIEYKKIWALTASTGSKNDWNKVQKIINRKKNKYPFSRVLRYAAIFVGVIGVSFVLNRTFNASEKLIIVDQEVLLKLDNGNSEILLSNKNMNSVNRAGYSIDPETGILSFNGKNDLDGSLNSTGISIPQTELVYNELQVPHGKRFQLILSDGTVAHLNAGTSLRYPVNFIKGKDRTVFLDGEAYFEVTKDTKHPFIVNVDNLNVRVLGTQFNISSYQDNNEISTTLIEGAVAIYKKDEAFNIESAALLEPSDKASWNKNTNEITIDMVDDTSIYTAWMEDKIIFKNTPFLNIRKALERIYNVTIINNNETLDKNTYNVFFDGESIEQILETLNINFSINYIIKNNQVIIN